MIYTKEALEAAKLKVIGNPTVEEQAYINGWNDALDAVINNCGTKGHWFDQVIPFFLTCSNCGCSIWDEKHELFESDGELNFCPNCGADMRQNDEV